jgi:hypothetical protein
MSLGLGCAAAIAVSPTVDRAGESILFIGNSLTASNDLPAQVAEIGTTAGHPLRTSAVTAPGASLLDHGEDERAVRAIRDGRWSGVVLQQGPSDTRTIVGARDSSMVLVGPDGFHPSVLGTYAAALTVACTLLPKDRPSLARAVAASVLRLDAGRRDLLVDAACTAATARH